MPTNAKKSVQLLTDVRVGALAVLACAVTLGQPAGCGDQNDWADSGGGDSDIDVDGDIDGDGDVDGDGDTDGDGGGPCVDTDGDGYGHGCAAGPDCDDGDPELQSDCTVIELGVDGEEAWDPTADNSSGVVLDDDGALTLEAHPEIEPAVWIANSREGTVSRLDSRSGFEVARYPSALDTMSRARPWNERCDSSEGSGNCPSRTAIDFRGDCWVANRAFGHQGTVTKFASHIEDCIDRDGDGEIQTSHDINGNGVIDLGTDEFLGTDDECVLFTVDVGGDDGIPRALAIAPDALGETYGGNAWVGLNSERRFAELHGDTGEVLRYVEVPINPYGALASKYNRMVWITNAGWQRDLPDNSPGVVSINIVTGEVSPRHEVRSTADCVGTYGITIDAEGMVWVAGHSCEGAFRFDPETEDWMTVEVPESGTSRGLVADADGWIWLAHSRRGDERIGLVTRFRAADGSELEYYWLPEGLGSIGVDLDVDGRIWTVNGNSSTASRIDPLTGEIAEFPTGDGPYTYSDFTGHSLLLQFPRGYYRQVMEACPGAVWQSLSWGAETPGDTRVELRVRSAAERIDLGAAEWIGPFLDSPASLAAPPGPVPDGEFLELEVTLISNDESALPRVLWVDISYECPVG
jgi:streptogramin lyase